LFLCSVSLALGVKIFELNIFYIILSSVIFILFINFIFNSKILTPRAKETEHKNKLNTVKIPIDIMTKIESIEAKHKKELKERDNKIKILISYNKKLEFKQEDYINIINKLKISNDQVKHENRTLKLSTDKLCKKKITIEEE
jgi:hypothetical protein